MDPSSSLKPSPHLRVVSLRTTNYKRIKAVQVDPAPGEPLVLIGGEIDNGKSSLLDSMLDVFGGKDASPEKPVRAGMKKSETVVDLGDVVCRLRHTSAGGRELIIEDKEGNRMKRPQDVMDALTGKIGFDAEAFIRMEPKKQLEVLKKIVGLDFAPMEAKKAGLYSQRTDANATVRSLETQLEASPNPADAPAALVDTSAVLAEMNAAQEFNKGREPLVEAYTNAKGTHEAAVQSLGYAQSLKVPLEKKIADLEAELKTARDTLAINERVISDRIKAFDEALAAKIAAENAGKAFVLRDLAPFQTQLSTADGQNQKFRQAEHRKSLAAALAGARTRATNLDNAVQEVDATKEKMLLEAKFPVKGLGFTESGITFDAIPFEQAASSTKRRVSVAIGAALNPTLRVMIIKDGSLLGTKGLAQVRELAREFDLQVWIEVVTSDEEDRKRCTVVIEDGTVLGAPPVEDIPEAPEKSSGGDTVKDAEPPKDLFSSLPGQ